MYRPLVPALLAGLLLGGALTGREAAPESYTVADAKRLGVEPVAPKRDPDTGFVVGGKNSTALIRKLTKINGRTIAELEKDMRPGALSRAGFLGPKESLLEVLAEDNRY